MTNDDKLNNSDEPAQTNQSDLAKQLRPDLEKILDSMLKEEIIEFEPENRSLLIDEMIEAAENARHPKAIFKAVLVALLKSDNVEEIYGSDPELLDHIQKAFVG